MFSDLPSVPTLCAVLLPILGCVYYLLHIYLAALWRPRAALTARVISPTTEASCITAPAPIAVSATVISPTTDGSCPVAVAGIITPLLVDATAIYAYWQYLRDQMCPINGNPDYAALLTVLNQRLPGGKAFDPKLAFVAISFENAPQQKFATFLSKNLGFIVDASDFRDAYIVPDNSYQRLSTRLTYLAGMLSHQKPHIVAVTDAFDVYHALVDMVKNRGCQATLAFFRARLEPRWQRVGLFNGGSPIKFLDLDPYAKEIIGADLASARRALVQGTGLGRLKIDAASA